MAQFSSVQSLSRVQLFVTPWIAACQASLSITNSRSSLRLMSMESVMPSGHSSSVIPFSSCPQSLPASESFPMSQLFAWGGQSIGVSVLASFLPKKSQGWSPSEWTGWISWEIGVPGGRQLSSRWLFSVLILYELWPHPVWKVASKVHICWEDNAWAGSVSQVWLGLGYLCLHFIG